MSYFQEIAIKTEKTVILQELLKNIMANILNIDTSTDVCSVALTSEGSVLEHREDYEGQNHAKVLSAFINDIMEYATPRGINLDAIAVCTGPGSYTGLRIGLSEAKGLCFGLDIPLIGLSTLELLVVTIMFKDFWDDDVLFVPMIDARRKEVFTGVYDLALNKVMQPQPLILDENSFSEYKDKTLVFIGKFRIQCAVCELPISQFSRNFPKLIFLISTVFYSFDIRRDIEAVITRRS